MWRARHFSASPRRDSIWGDGHHGTPRRSCPTVWRFRSRRVRDSRSMCCIEASLKRSSTSQRSDCISPETRHLFRSASSYCSPQTSLHRRHEAPRVGAELRVPSRHRFVSMRADMAPGPVDRDQGAAPDGGFKLLFCSRVHSMANRSFRHQCSPRFCIRRRYSMAGSGRIRRRSRDCHTYQKPCRHANLDVVEEVGMMNGDRSSCLTC